MKKNVLLCACIFLSGCTAGNTDVSITEMGLSSVAAAESVPTAEENTDDVFHGFTDAGEAPHIGNTMSCINRSGILYNGDELIYGDGGGDLKKGDAVLAEKVFPTCINVNGGKIYYVNGNDGKIYFLDEESGEGGVYYDAQAVLLAVTDRYFIYEDTRHSLYIVRDGSAELISDKKALWVGIYGKYVIYCELDNGCGVSAFDTQSGDITPLLDYGFFPSVYGDMLYYQEKDNGYVCKLDLLTGEMSEAVRKWGQQFSFAGGEMYYVDSRGIHSDSKGEVYIPDGGTTVEDLFECGGELFFTERSEDEKTYRLYRLDTANGERTLIE